MLKLVAENGRWAYKDNSMIFGNVVWISTKKDARLYHLIEEDSLEEVSNFHTADDFIIEDNRFGY